MPNPSRRPSRNERFLPAPPRLLLLAALCAVLALVLLPAAPAALGQDAGSTREWSEELELRGASAVQVKAPVAKIVLEGATRDTVSAELRVKCRPGTGSRCPERAEKVHLKSGRRGRWLVLDLDGLPKDGNREITAELTLRLPRALAVEVDLGVGDVEATGLIGDLEVDIGVGDARLELDAARVQRVYLDSGVGDVTLETPQGRREGKGLVGHSLSWSAGLGEADVEVDLGVGEATVVLK